MAEKMDYKKEYPDLYVPRKTPALVDVPAMRFIMVDGQGDPNGSAYQSAVQTLYALSFTIKMSKKGNTPIEDYFEYVVPPLEGLWWWEDGVSGKDVPRSAWLWTSMIRQPEFVTAEVFAWAVAQVGQKKPEIDLTGARFETFEEGLCIQALHRGAFSEEGRTLAAIHEYIEQNELVDCTGSQRKHHEIYLSDPRRTAPETFKTVLRLPVAHA